MYLLCSPTTYRHNIQDYNSGKVKYRFYFKFYDTIDTYLDFVLTELLLLYIMNVMKIGNTGYNKLNTRILKKFYQNWKSIIPIIIFINCKYLYQIHIVFRCALSKSYPPALMQYPADISVHPKSSLTYRK